MINEHDLRFDSEVKINNDAILQKWVVKVDWIPASEHS